LIVGVGFVGNVNNHFNKKRNWKEMQVLFWSWIESPIQSGRWKGGKGREYTQYLAQRISKEMTLL
jgi:hypothetical protein